MLTIKSVSIVSKFAYSYQIVEIFLEEFKTG